ncbi:MAG TPA: aminotransferase class III-fold pyridoxal phosphate-dependent enzyme [Alphaproteobacteria bacterium]|nr:aminotransferase class III-fold pyridoxal phosphate-dependent enzyme [Alphaproteobacteria bacterium]
MPNANTDLAACVAEAERHYISARPESRRLNAIAAEAMPGGNTRTILFYTPFPSVLARGSGCRVIDVDGHEYLDFLGEYSAGLYGHDEPRIRRAIEDALADGIVLGGPNRHEIELAYLLKERIPSLELLRFCNSGTEANLFAISAARTFTGRDSVLVFHHAYHGGLSSFGTVGAKINAPFPWLLGSYNEIPSALALIERSAAELAAVLIEPMQGASGCIPANAAFLQALRDSCTRHGIVLIFDEVMTSRCGPGGLQARLGIRPDMTTLGKYLGGGLAFGAFGGRREIMQLFDPSRPDALPHAGTFNNNVLAMAAGVAGLREVFTRSECERLFGLGERLREGVNELAARLGVPIVATGVGSMVGLHFHDGPISSAETFDGLPPEGKDRRGLLKKLFHLDMLEKGVYLSRRGFVSLSLPMRERETETFLTAIEEFIGERRSLLRL